MTGRLVSALLLAQLLGGCAATTIYEVDGDLPVLSQASLVAQLRAQRRALVEDVWSSPEIPAALLPDRIDTGVRIDAYADLPGLARIDSMVVELELGLRSIILHFHPASPTDEAVILHQGHAGLVALAPVIAGLLARGYAVLGMEMPLVGRNALADSVETASGARFRIATHGDLLKLEDEGVQTMRYFLSPVAAVVNHLAGDGRYRRLHMVGLSGGGWTTTLYAALDPRIGKSVPVAGSLPFHLRDDAGSIGDYEQLRERSIYRFAGFLDLYVLAGLEPGRRQLQVLNAVDPCCFAAAPRLESIREYVEVVQGVLEAAGGGVFELVVDDTHAEHAISPWAIDVICQEIGRPVR
jgi:pimeloyl-ACP methyl ester carboxylesterase